MSTSTGAGGPRTRADRTLFARLVDDAAVFPPGLAPLPDAVAAHRSLQAGPWADLVGPLLVPVTSAESLLGLHPEQDGPLAVGLVARAGTALAEVEVAVRALGSSGQVALHAVELAHSSDWHRSLRWDLPLAVEVPRHRVEQRAVLAALAQAGDEAVGLVAKLRTQSTAQEPVPDAEELTDFLLRCLEHGLGFKLTGGLHHAVATSVTDADGGVEDQHGVLNVLIAVHRAVQGHSHDDVREALLERDATDLVDQAQRITGEEASAVRSQFRSFGCCGVLDPIHELRGLGLLSGEEEQR